MEKRSYLPLGVPAHWIAAQVSCALIEDIGVSDWTTMLVPVDQWGCATVVSREVSVICGQSWFVEVFRQIDPSATVQWQVEEGDRVDEGAVVCNIQGAACTLLTAERTALNFLQLLSGVASETRRYVEAIKGTKAKICDTRKTIPGLRSAQKYAVRVGGGENQRMGLYDGVLIKENHIIAAGGVRSALEAARRYTPSAIPIQVEVEHLNQLEEALDAGATSILLDNMDLDGLREAVVRSSGRALLEASGGIELGTVRSIAETGVDRISIGKLTKEVRSIDFSMRFS